MLVKTLMRYTLKDFLGTNSKKYDSRKDLLHLSKYAASKKCQESFRKTSKKISLVESF